MKKRLQQGFTVLEFLIVIAIMCILIAIALASLTSSREKAVDEKKITELKTAALGIEQYSVGIIRHKLLQVSSVREMII